MEFMGFAGQRVWAFIEEVERGHLGEFPLTSKGFKATINRMRGIVWNLELY